ncbi:MAG: DUF3048 domain-containing protein [Caldilineaceae bacterium]|nr:DUF3048 domain-containing protein [Caldilineaceae bacterium]MBP8108911.1 DUF3048 domain-containing protein [Caldilineaceae bacterium]MBP8124038.1 DUF3048 domain-containing protein [Caldilineaceae bacterium]MBP9074692.1 DUF3048 domain-containing protein [Caldilineaceae bacterium]
MTQNFGSTPPLSRPPQAPRPRRWLPLAIILVLLTALAGTIAVVTFGPDSLRRPSAEVVTARESEPTVPAPSTEIPALKPTATPTVPSPTPEAAPTPTPVLAQPLEPVGVVNGGVVNVREGPSTAYAILGQVREGDEVKILGRDEDGTWWQICCVGEGQTGWMAAEFVDAGFSAEAGQAIPVAEAPPLPTPAPAVVGSSSSGDQSAALLAAPASGLPGPGGFPAPGGTNPLTGLPLSAENQNRRPAIVCVNNDFAARPQYGLAQADVAYDYLMEGFSITRFSAIYYGDDAARIGPVRSARLINYYLGALYDAGLLCSGASDRVRYILKNDAPFPYLDIDLDDPNNSRYSSSLGSDYRTRLQTSTAGLRAFLANTGTQRAPSLRGFTFGEVPGGGAPASQVNIPFPSVTGSQVAYAYDVGSGRFLRFMGGIAHVDGSSGAQLGFDNVVVQYVPHEVTDIVEDSLGSKSIRLNLFGSGRAIVFRNGLAFEGTWRSDSRGDTPRFFANDGSEIPLKPGKTWISVVPLNYSIAYQ